MLPEPHPAVVAKSVGDGTVLLHTETEVYFGLNGVGREIWDLLPPKCHHLGEVCVELSRVYPDVDEGTLRQDVSELLESLLEQGLVLGQSRRFGAEPALGKR